MTGPTPTTSKPLASKPTCIKTRFLILSDTHNRDSPPDSALQPVDVVLHCGDLTKDSTLDEFKSSIRLLKSLNAPLKLVIPGNHDLALDEPAYNKNVAKVRSHIRLGSRTEKLKQYGPYGKTKELFEKERENGIILLDEGNHTFHLKNGAILKLYASPYTRSCGEWGFQYSKRQSHEFLIGEADIVMTHGPPEGVMDYSLDGTRLGCSRLFEAVARVKPKMHCFGHIHEGWGAKLVTWKGGTSAKPSFLTDIDHGKTVRIKGLHSDNLSSECEFTSHCAGDAHPLKEGAQTLFVNAAVDGRGDMPDQSPWIVELELASAL